MLTEWILEVRERYHPLFHLRKLSFFRGIMGMMDFPIAIRIEGIAHPVFVSFSRNLSWILSNGKVVESDERASFRKLTGAAGCKSMYDIGANVGLYAFMFASADASRSVLMFEPDSVNAKLIRATLSRFPLQSCDLIEAAVCDRDGSLTFHADSVSGATGSINEEQSFLQKHHHGRTVPVTVRCVSLDRVSPDANADPDVIKIDAEGAELSIFRGAEALISRSRPILFFECDKNKIEILRHLSERGYRLFDATTLESLDFPAHNCVALHCEKHSAIIDSLSPSGALNPIPTG